MFAVDARSPARMPASTAPPSATKPQLGPTLSVKRLSLFKLLQQLAMENQAHFSAHGCAVHDKRIAECCEEINTNVRHIETPLERLQDFANLYDYDEKTPGNGFRSLVYICDTVTLQLVAILKNSTDTRTGLMFSSKRLCKELESFAAIFRFLILAFEHVLVLADHLKPKDILAELGDYSEQLLFPPLDAPDYSQFNGVLKGIESLDASCFYGRSLGFQFCPSVTRIFRLIGIVLATYSLSWDLGSGALSSLVASSRYLLNPEQRAHRIVKVTREADIEFCRGFWNLSEIPAPKLFCPSMAVYEIINIPMMGPLELQAKNTSQGNVVISEPSSHGPPMPIRMRVFSAVHRKGLSSALPGRTLAKPSKNLVVHCHGGGYVATSSKSHETYLRYWAKSLNCTLVSIEYSLSPEFPYPRPTEEVLYAYAWMQKNASRLGWTGDTIVMCGDSAGGNLVVSTTLRLIELGVKKLPDGLVPIYTPFLFQYLPSPSRVLSFMDPLLHMGVVIRCAAAYTNACPNGTKAENERRAAEKETKVSHKSLIEYVNEIKHHRSELFDSAQDFGSQTIVSLVNLSRTALNSSVAPGPTPCNSLVKPLPGIAEQKSADSDEGSLQLSEATTSHDSSSGSDSAVHSGSDSANHDEEEDEDTEKDLEDGVRQAHPNQTMVHVNADPCLISLSASNYDHNLLDYLQSHPLTKESAALDISMESSNSGVENYDLDSSAPKTPLNTPVAELHDDAFEEIPETEDLRSPSVKSCLSFFRTPDKSLGSGQKKRLVQTEKKRLCQKKKVTRVRSLSSSFLETASMAAGYAYDQFSHWLEGDHDPLGHADKPKLTRSQTMSAYESALMQQAEAENLESCFTELLKLNLPRNHLISPMYCNNDLLKALPPMRFVALHLDPLLDDTISFARRLRAAGGRVASIDLLDALPHGFLNFTPMSTECREGAEICLRRIQDALASANK